jgi:RNA polymerase sigma-70 factor (ECF subfamily)
MKDTGQNENDEDLELLSRCRRGEVEAFEALVVRHQKKMINIAFRMTGDYEDACEVVQDAFLAAYRSLGTFRGEAKFSSWLCSIVMNTARNRIKQSKARNSREGFSIDAPIATEDGQVTLDLPSDAPSALEEMGQREVQQRVQDCIKALDPDYREVLVLRDIQGYSYCEIHGMLGLAEGTVKSRIFRARDAIKDCLKKIMGEAA